MAAHHDHQPADYRHRDRVAFVRVVSGRFRRDMTAHNPRTGRDLRLSNAQRLFARHHPQHHHRHRAQERRGRTVERQARHAQPGDQGVGESEDDERGGHRGTVPRDGWRRRREK